MFSQAQNESPPRQATPSPQEEVGNFVNEMQESMEGKLIVSLYFAQLGWEQNEGLVSKSSLSAEMKHYGISGCCLLKSCSSSTLNASEQRCLVSRHLHKQMHRSSHFIIVCYFR